MAVYSGENPGYLRDCFASLESQTLPADQVVLVVDGPISMQIEEVIEDFQHRLPLETLRIAANGGLAAALNVGLKRCAGDYVARLDTDDVAMESRFLIQTGFLEARRDVDILGSFARVIDSAGKPDRLMKRPVDHSDIIRHIWTNPIIHPSVMVRAEVFRILGGYDESLRRSEDHELWFRAAANRMTFHNLDVPLIHYRVTPTSHSRHGFRSAMERARVASRGARLMGMPAVVQIASYAPAIRALAPVPLRRPLSLLMQHFDPRVR